MRREIRVGIFLTGALMILAVFIFIVGNLSTLFQPRGYPIIVRYDTSLGLDKTAAVKMAGIKIGWVRDIQLEVRRSRVTLSIFPKYKIPRGSKAVQAVQGLLGEKYVEIQPSTSNEFCQPGEELVAGPGTGLDQLAPLLNSLGNDLQLTVRNLQEMTNKDTRENFSQALKNIAAMSSEIQTFLAENKGKLGQTIALASNTARTVDQKVRDIAQSFDSALGEIHEILEDNRGDVRESITGLKELLSKMEESVSLLNKSLEKIQKGEGSVGKLINDEGLYDEARGAVRDVRKIADSVSSLTMHLDVRGEYLARSRFFKPALTLDLWYRNRVFFLAQVVDKPSEAQPSEGRLAYSAQGGVRLANFAPRAGIIESEFGAGLDYYALKDRLVLSVEGLNFNRTKSPMFRTFARFYPQKNVYLILGLEDFTLSAKREVFFGLGLGL